MSPDPARSPATRSRHGTPHGNNGANNQHGATPRSTDGLFNVSFNAELGDLNVSAVSSSQQELLRKKILFPQSAASAFADDLHGGSPFARSPPAGRFARASRGSSDFGDGGMSDDEGLDSSFMSSPRRHDGREDDLSFSSAKRARGGSSYGGGTPSPVVFSPPSVENGIPQITVLCSIGQGNFGYVERVRDKRSNKHYAMKRSIKPMSSIKQREQFLKEMRHWAAAHDRAPEHIVQLHKAWQEDGILYTLMQLCTGGTLDKYSSVSCSPSTSAGPSRNSSSSGFERPRRPSAETTRR